MVSVGVTEACIFFFYFGKSILLFKLILAHKLSFYILSLFAKAYYDFSFS